MHVLKDFFKESKYLLSKRLNKWYATFKTGYGTVKLILKPYAYHKQINANAMNNLSESSRRVIRQLIFLNYIHVIYSDKL